MEKVSIVVPVYNMGDKIETCVQSLIKQTYENIEIILVDDGSKDDSYQYCLQLAEKDARIVALHTENKGSGPARNYGIDHASGRYIYFPDADDYIEPSAISIMVCGMMDGSFDLVVFGYKNVNQNGKLVKIKEYSESEQDADDIRNNYGEYMTTLSKWGIQGAPWNKFFDLNVIKNNNIRYPSLRRHQDEGFIGRYMCYATKVHFIPDVLYTYYVNDLQKEWQKYPVDYVDAVIGLYGVRKETILTWNDKDKKTREFIEQEYLCNMIKAFELSYSPKMKLTRKSRLKWIRNQSERSQILDITIPESLGRYQKIVFTLLKKGYFSLAVLIIHIKVFIEKRGALNLFRRLQ